MAANDTAGIVMVKELRCGEEHLQATIEDGMLYIACAACSHKARKAGLPSPVTHAFSIAELLAGGDNGDAFRCPEPTPKKLATAA